MFAHVIRLPDVIFEMEDESAILVTVNTILSILVPANLTRSAIYLDIPFDRISNIKMSKSDSQSQRRSQHSQSQTTTPCCMDIELTDSSGWTHLINHKTVQASSIGIVFDYMPDAIAVHEALDARQAVLHDNNVSPGQLQYDPTSPVTETSTDRQDRLLTSEPAASMCVLQAIESDLITCAGDEAHGEIARSEGGSNIGTLRTDRNTALDSVRISPQAEAKRNFVGDTNGGTAEFETVQGSLAVNISHTPTAGEPPTQEKRQVHIIDVQQQVSSPDPLLHSSSQSQKLKHLRDALDPQALHERNEDHRLKNAKGVKTAEAKNKRQSRNLGDHHGLLSNAGPVKSHDGDSPGVYADTNSKRASAAGQACAAGSQPRTQGGSKAHSNIINSEIPGHRESEFQKSDHDKVYESAETLDQGGKQSRTIPAPEASMVAQPNDKELQRKGKAPINTSNISRPRPKPQIRSTRISKRPSGSKEKKSRSPNDEEEDVDWFEDMNTDHSSDNAMLTRDKTPKQPDISTKSKKGKTGRAQNKAISPKKPATSRSTQKPRRAAAVKADMKIRGLPDTVSKGLSPGKKTIVKHAVNMKSASETAPPPEVESGGKPDITVKASNQVKKSAARLEKDTSRQPPNVRAPPTFIRSPTQPESSHSPNHRTGRKSGRLPAHAVNKLTNPSESDEDVSLPIPTTQLVKESIVEPNAGVPGAVLNGSYNMDKDQSMAETATEQHGMDHPLDFSEKSPLDESWHPHAESDRTFLQPQAPNSAATLHEPKTIVGDLTQKTSPLSAVSEVHSEFVHSSQPEESRGDFSGVHVDSPEVLNSTPKLSHHKSRSSKDVDHGASAFSKHLISPSASQKLNDRIAEDKVRKRFTKIDHFLTARKWEEALSPITALQAEDHDVEARSTLRAARDGNIVAVMSKEARTIGRTAQHQAPVEGKVRVTEKRRIDEEDPRQAKKSRVAGWQPHQDLDGARAEVQTPKNNVPELRRKPVVVHFEASGPKYERIQLPKKSKMPSDLTMPQSKQGQHSTAIQSSKRKPFDTVNDGPWARDDLPNRKRRKGEHTNMQPTSRGIGDAITVQPRIRSGTGKVHHHSSQSSRVNEQGSPMPTAYSQKVSLAIPKVTAPTPEIPMFSSDVSGNEGYYCSDDDAPQIPEHSVPAARHDTLAPIAKTKTVVGRNTKHRPGSPNAPSSMIANMTAHSIQPSGQFVGIKTNDVVVPQNPQDPFVDTAQNQPAGKFIELLRKHSNEQKMVETKNDNGRHEDGDITTHLGGNDPDKTLFEENLSENEESSTVSSFSSSSCTSEMQSQGDATPSDDGSESDSAWKKALRDDQRDILEKLHEISHVDVCCHPSCVRC